MLLKENTFNKNKFVKMFIANIIGWIIVLLSEYFDSFLAGNLINADALAALEIVTPLEYIMYACAMITGFSVGILYSRELGNHNKLLSKQIAGMSLIVSFIGACLLAVLFYAIAPLYVSFFNCSANVSQYAISAIRCLIYSFPIIFIYYDVYHLVTYDGNETIILINDIALVGFAILIPYLLTLKLGIDGIFYAYIVTYSLGTLLLLPHFFSKRNSISFKPYFSFKILIEMFKLSFCTLLTNVYIFIVDVIFNAIIVKKFGDGVLPAYTIVNLLLNTAECLTATMTGAQIFISTYYGEKSYKSIRRVMKMVYKYTFILAIILSIVCIIIAPYWPEIFAIGNELAITYAKFAGYVIPSTYLFSALVYTFQNYYPNVDKPQYANNIATLYMFLTPMAICLPLVYLFGFEAMVIGFALTPVFTVLIMYAYFKLTKKKDIPLFLPESDNIEIHHDLYLVDEDICEVKDLIFDELRKYDINQNIAQEACIVAEDTLMYIKNKNRKKTLAEITILFDTNCLSLIVKDNGKIFDLVEAVKDADSLRAYTIDCLTNDTFVRENDVAISFNRNMYSWKLKENAHFILQIKKLLIEL